MSVKAISLSQIVKGRNPRTYFDEAEMAELIASIRANGLLQPIVVRQVGDKYEIIAGERRYRAVLEIQGENGEILALVKECSDEEAEVLALIENINRADMSPTEEAVAANRLLARLRDKVEVAAQLGWPLFKLDRRLALMNCTEQVRQALNERKIMLGHAELLAALHPDKQEQALAIVLSNNLTIADLKRSLTNLAQKLEEAIFDKADCLACHHNSGTQSALFTENIGDGACTHPTCYQEKTTAHLEGVRSKLARVVNRVEFLELGEDKIIPIKLVAEGIKGVGDAQATACKGCASFGAIVSKLPGELGKVEHDICFDQSCHSEKVNTYLKHLTEEAEQEKAAANPAAGKTAAAAVSSSGSSTRVTAPQAKAGEHRNAIKEYAEKQIRRIAARAVTRHKDKAPELLLWMITSGYARHIPDTKARDALNKLSGFDLKTGPSLSAVSDAAAVKEGISFSAMAASVGYGLIESVVPLSASKAMIKHLGVDLTKEWKVNQEFLDLLTKAEMEAFALQCGLKAAIGEEGYKKLFNNKKEDVVAGLLAHADTHFAGKLHESISC